MVKSPVGGRLCGGAAVFAALTPAVQRRICRLKAGSRTFSATGHDFIRLCSDCTVSPAHGCLLPVMAFLHGSDGLPLIFVPRPARPPHHLLVGRLGALHYGGFISAERFHRLDRRRLGKSFQIGFKKHIFLFLGNAGRVRK